MHHYPTITGRKIKIAVVGCGRISRNHFGSIEKHGDEFERANRFGCPLHAQRYSS